MPSNVICVSFSFNIICFVYVIVLLFFLQLLFLRFVHFPVFLLVCLGFTVSFSVRVSYILFLFLSF